MKKINKDELFAQVSEFLKGKGIELQDGSYTQTIHKGCQVLADTINLSQQAMARTKAEIDKHLDRVREVIHTKTAPKKPPVQPNPVPPRAETAQPAGAGSSGKARSPKGKRRPVRKTKKASRAQG
jgi:hypothetical protein